MKKLEKNKREVAYISFIAVTLIFISLYIIVPFKMFKSFIIIPYIISLYVYYKLYTNGIAGLTRAIFNFVSYADVYAITTYLSKNANLNMEPHLLQYIGFIVLFLIYHTFRIPHALEDGMTEYIYRKDIEKIDEKTNNVPDYSKYEFMQEVQSYTSKPYSFTKCTFEQKLVRIVASLVLLTLPITSIVTGKYLFAILCSIYAISLIRNGFIRASVFPIATYAYVVFTEYMKPAFCFTVTDRAVYSLASKSYIPKFILEGLKIKSDVLKYIILVGAMIIIIMKLSELALYMFKKTKEFYNVQTFKKDNISKSCDMFLKEIAPIRLYSKLMKFDIEISKNDGKLEIEEAKKLNYIINDIHTEAVESEFIVAGTQIGEQKTNVEIYIYTKESEIDEVQNSIEKICKMYMKKVTLTEVMDDPEWNFYLNEIFPDKYISQEMFNAKYINMLSKMQITLDDDHKLLYYFYFKNKADIKKFLKVVCAKNYVVESVDDLKAYKDIGIANEEYPYGVILSNVSKLGIHRMNMTTKELIDDAKDSSGFFDGWTISEIFDKVGR